MGDHSFGTRHAASGSFFFLIAENIVARSYLFILFGVTCFPFGQPTAIACQCVVEVRYHSDLKWSKRNASLLGNVDSLEMEPQHTNKRRLLTTAFVNFLLSRFVRSSCVGFTLQHFCCSTSYILRSSNITLEHAAKPAKLRARLYHSVISKTTGEEMKSPDI